MKTDRFASVLPRAAAVTLAGLLLLAAGAAGQTISLRFGGKGSRLAAALARQVRQAQQRFDTNRRALRTLRSPGGEPAHPREEVAGLIDRTGEDLDQAIERVGEPGLDALRAWAAEELQRLERELAAPSGHSAATLPSTPRAVAVIARLGRPPLPGLARVSAAAPRQETIPAETSNRLLDEVGEVVGRILFLAERNDLEVKLWVGSTPAPKATFSFWPQGQHKGSTPAPLIIRTNGKRDRVLRGLYAYRATFGKGSVTELVQYPIPAGAPATRLASERLDLVNGSSFFCCRFSEQYCHHVASTKECRP